MPSPSKLFNRNFFLLWQGNFISQLGTQAFAIAMLFWIKHTTGSASLMGGMMMISMLPAVILSPIAGTIADHYSRRKIIILCDVLSGVPGIILAIYMLLAPDAIDTVLIGLFVVSLMLGVIRTFFSPAISAAIPDIVPKEKIDAANSVNQSTVQISILLGQGIGGYLFVLIGAPLLILIDGITYLFSAFSESFMKIPQKLPEKSRLWKDKFQDFKKDTIEGFRYAWGNAGLRALFFAASFLNFFATPFIMLLPFYVEDVLKVSAAWYGYLLAGFGFGALVGYAIAGAMKLSGKMRSRAVIAALILTSVGIFLFSLVQSSIIALFLSIAVGIVNGFINVNIMSIVQLSTASEIRGRMFGLLTTLTGGLMPISMGLSGIIADLLNQNIPLIYAGCGIITIVLSILTGMSKDFRTFMAFDNQLSRNHQ